MSVEGVDRLVKSLQRMKDKDLKAVGWAVDKTAEECLKIALELVPKEYGDLAASGHVEVSMWKTTSKETLVVFGGRAPSGKLVDYAVIVHEDMTATHAPGTGAKYLEKAIRMVKARLVDLLNKKVSET